MSNIYLKTGYMILWLVAGLGILAFVLKAFLLFGHLTGLTSLSDMITIQPDGSLSVWFIGEQARDTDLSGWAIYFLLIRSMIIIGIWLYIFRLIQSVLGSVKDLSTFQVENIRTFRMMGISFLIMFLLDLFSLTPGPSDLTLTFSLSLTNLALAAAAFLLGEVFREGHELYEQNRLMI